MRSNINQLSGEQPLSISIFDIFTVGIGPSSSHTVGPMRATKDFISQLESDLNTVHRISITLYGSLAFTGRGHGTDKALMMGLLGEAPESVNPDSIPSIIAAISKNKKIALLHRHSISFSPETDILYNYEQIYDFHPNAMKFVAFDSDEKIMKETMYYSIGGGFIVNENDTLANTPTADEDLPYPFQTAADLLAHCHKNSMTIADVMLENEKTWRTEEEIKAGLLDIAAVMEACIEKGCHTEGELSGQLRVRRRAPALLKKLIQRGDPNAQHPQTMNWLNLYAMAVNEENAAGGRVVTAPTNGAAGIIPSVLKYYKNFCVEVSESGIINYLLTAGAIGLLYKKNASISGAEMGCQGEVGVACSMAAGALAAALDGTVSQVENAAEIGMEHNLGLTCDPVDGLVQIPCIERNAMGAVKAVNAARLALAEDGDHKVTLDMVINTMREIGKNMNTMYKETSKGGLAVAVNITEC